MTQTQTSALAPLFKEDVFGPGTTFKTMGKNPNLCTVVDIHYTYNLQGELVKKRYIATHQFMGQTVKGEYPVVSIQRGLVEISYGF